MIHQDPKPDQCQFLRCGQPRRRHLHLQLLAGRSLRHRRPQHQRQQHPPRRQRRRRRSLHLLSRKRSRLQGQRRVMTTVSIWLRLASETASAVFRRRTTRRRPAWHRREAARGRCSCRRQLHRQRQSQHLRRFRHSLLLRPLLLRQSPQHQPRRRQWHPPQQLRCGQPRRRHLHLQLLAGRSLRHRRPQHQRQQHPPRRQRRRRRSLHLLSRKRSRLQGQRRVMTTVSIWLRLASETASAVFRRRTTRRRPAWHRREAAP